jgi:hypothetical protein
VFDLFDLTCVVKQAMSAKLTQTALDNGAKDNISVMVQPYTLNPKF